MKRLVTIKSGSRGQTENRLLFKAYISSDNHRKYEFEYIGTDVEKVFPLTDEQYDAFIEKLNKDFGYAPFKDLAHYKTILGEGKSYEVQLICLQEYRKNQNHHNAFLTYSFSTTIRDLILC